MEKENGKLLAGAKGTVCLMFLQRHVNTFHIVRKVLDAKIVKNTPTVYGYVNELQRKNLIRLVEVEKGKRGPSKLRTANAEPLIETIKKHYELFEDRWLEGLQTLCRNLNGVLDYFPEYLSVRTNKKVENLSWEETLSIFLSFCKQIVNECYWLKKNPHANVSIGYSSIEKEYAEGRLNPELYRLLKNSNIVMAPHGYIKESLKQGTFTQKNLTSLANLSGDLQYDIYEDTFSGELFYMSVALKDPDLAYSLKRHIKSAVEYGKHMRK